MAADNKTLGRFQLTDIPAAPRGVPQIEVTFDIDKNGIVTVKAKDLGTNKEQNIVIQSDSGLSEADIERMVKEAEENAEADRARKEEADLRNEADQLVFQTDKTLADLGEQVTEDEKKPVEEAKEELAKAIEAGEIEGIKAAKEKLEGLLQPLVMKVYEQAAAAQQAAQGAEGAQSADSSNNNGDDVVDGEFTEK